MDKQLPAESVVPEVPAETPDAFDLAQSGMRVARKLVAANLLLREARDLLYHEEDVYGSFVHNEDWERCPGCDLERRIDEHFDGGDDA